MNSSSSLHDEILLIFPDYIFFFPPLLDFFLFLLLYRFLLIIHVDASACPATFHFSTGREKEEEEERKKEREIDSTAASLFFRVEETLSSFPSRWKIENETRRRDLIRIRVDCLMAVRRRHF